MKSHLIAWSSLALLFPLGTIACGGADVHANVAVQTPDPPQPVVGGEAPASGDVAVGADTDSYQDNDPAALQDFHPALDNSGTWQDDPTYGTVWVPSQQVVGADFTPYQTAGHWVYDNDDYVWVSDYDWGWAPFHYGRWVPLDAGGWAWIPGREYRGAWVNWGADDAYANVGWYPMGPEFVWRGGVAVSYTYNVAPRWAYVGRGDVFAPNIGARVFVGPAAAGFSGSVHPFQASGGARFASGPAPTRLGFTAANIPHASGAASANLAKAAQFGRPSTAVALGAHPATRVSTPSASAHAGGGMSATMPGARGNVPTTGAAGAAGNANLHGTATGTVAEHNNMAPATGGGTAAAGTPSPHGSASGRVTPGVQPQPQGQPKKKPTPQESNAPVPKKGGAPKHK